MVLAALSLAAFLFLACTEPQYNNPNDPYGSNYIGNNSKSSSSGKGSSSSAISPCGEYDPDKQFCDSRDSKIYKWVEIGEQIWMAENLNYAAEGSKCGDGSSLSDENTATCDTYGRLYNWVTAMDGSGCTDTALCNPPAGTKGICPAGWHIPSDEEWGVLMETVVATCTNHKSACSGAGKKLKANSDLWKTNTGTDDYGFAALPGGEGSKSGTFSNAGYVGCWWSSSESGVSNIYTRIMNRISDDVNRGNNTKGNLYSIRCVKD